MTYIQAGSLIASPGESLGKGFSRWKPSAFFTVDGIFVFSPLLFFVTFSFLCYFSSTYSQRSP